MTLDPCSGFVPGEEPPCENKARNHRLLDRFYPARWIPRQHDFVRKTVEQMKRGRAPVGKAGRVDDSGLGVPECRAKAERLILLAASTGFAISAVFAFQHRLAQSVCHDVLHPFLVTGPSCFAFM